MSSLGALEWLTTVSPSCCQTSTQKGKRFWSLCARMHSMQRKIGCACLSWFTEIRVFTLIHGKTRPNRGGTEHSQANMSKTAFRPILQSVLLCVQQCFFNIVLNLHLKAIVTRLCTKYLKLEKHLPYLAAKSMHVFYSLSAPLQTQTPYSTTLLGAKRQNCAKQSYLHGFCLCFRTSLFQTWAQKIL